MAVTKDEVFSKVRTALVDALGVDDEEVTPEATMVGDLGAGDLVGVRSIDRARGSAEAPHG